jgi:hypothetical protein
MFGKTDLQGTHERASGVFDQMGEAVVRNGLTPMLKKNTGIVV